jgi:sortase A
MTNSQTNRVLRWLEYCLWLGALTAFAWLGVTWWNARTAQQNAGRELEQKRQEVKAAVQPPPRIPPQYGELVARLEVPRLGLSTIVFEGTEEPVLAKGAGHLPDSALPGDSGNVVIAGHRDTFFRKLKDIQKEDMVALTTPEGTHLYSVDTMQVIEPTETTVLDPTKEDVLTLVTCYPFQFIGHAPNRFIVRAHRVTERPQPGTHVSGLLPPSLTTIEPPRKATERERATAAVRATKPKPARTAGRDDESVQTAAASDAGESAAEPGAASKSRFGWLKPGRWLGKLGRGGKRDEPAGMGPSNLEDK